MANYTPPGRDFVLPLKISASVCSFVTLFLALLPQQKAQSTTNVGSLAAPTLNKVSSSAPFATKVGATKIVARQLPETKMLGANSDRHNFAFAALTLLRAVGEDKAGVQ